MIIKSIKFKHVKGFKINQNQKDGFFYFDFNANSNILIGKNGVGKSTVLEIIKFITYGYIDKLTQEFEEKLIFPPHIILFYLLFSLVFIAFHFLIFFSI